MKKIFNIIIVLLLVLLITSCQKSDNNNDLIIPEEDDVDEVIIKDPDQLIRNGDPIKNINGEIIMLPQYLEKEKEVRAIWIASVFNIDIPKMITTTPTIVNNYKNQIIKMLDNIEKMNFNTVFFQIRPMNDAFYRSNLAPWSRFITGSEGKDPTFDVLEFVIDEAHKRGLELHGWLNPYRVSSNQDTFKQMSDNNFGKLNPDTLLTDGTAHILNPGLPKVQKYISDVIDEIITNYPEINGVHFDDYFYLSSKVFTDENQNSPDYQTYLEFRTDTNQTIANFRRMSVTNMIKNVNNIIEKFNKSNNKNIKFGISPTGVWNNKSSSTPEGSDTRGYQSYSQLYADTKLWVENEYIDYIVPQIYFEFTNPYAPFAHLVDWWDDLVANTNVKLIIGQGLYKQRDTTPFSDENEILEQLRYIQNKSNVSGVSMYTYNDIIRGTPVATKNTLDTLKNEYWLNKAELNWD